MEARIQIYQQDTMGESHSYSQSFIRLLVPVVRGEWSHWGLSLGRTWMTSPLFHVRNLFFFLWSPRCRQPFKVRSMIVFDKVLCRVTWPTHTSLCRLTAASSPTASTPVATVESSLSALINEEGTLLIHTECTCYLPTALKISCMGLRKAKSSQCNSCKTR